MNLSNKSKEELISELENLREKYFCLEESCRKNIEEHQKSQEVLQNERILLRTLIDNIPDSIYCKDLKCRKTLSNSADVHYMKATCEEDVLGKDDFEFYPAELAEKFYADDQSVITSGKQVLNREEYIIDDNGEIRWLLSSKIPLRNKNNQIIGIIGIGRDITDRKLEDILVKEQKEEIEAQNEEYQQLNEELRQINEELYYAKEKAEESDCLKTAFLHNMSHEVRTPMNAITGFSSLLLENLDNKSKIEKYSKLIYQSSFDLLEIINNILNVAQIESGQLPITREEFKLNDLFAELTVLFSDNQKRLGKEHIEFYLKPQELSGESIIFTDIVKLKQIFINLLGNAFKFTNEGRIEGGCKYDKNHNLIFHVSDTGIGIPLERQKVIFDRFIQVNQDPNNKNVGNGLGLSIVKGLVDLLGGEIFLESAPGKGTTFYFTISKNGSSVEN